MWPITSQALASLPRSFETGVSDRRPGVRPRARRGGARIVNSRLARRAVLLATSLVLSALISGCIVFSHPVASAPGEVVDLAPYLGVWWYHEGGVSVTVEWTGPNALRGELIDPSNASTRTSADARLTVIDGRTLASVRVPDSVGFDRAAWNVFDVRRLDDGERLWFVPASRKVVEAAVGAGRLEGTPGEFMPNWDTGAWLAVDGEDLRTFVAAEPALFDEHATSAESVTLARNPPPTPTDLPVATATTEWVPSDARDTYDAQTLDAYPSPWAMYGSDDEAYPWLPALETPAAGSSQAGAPSGYPGEIEAGDGAVDGGMPRDIQRFILALVGVLVAGGVFVLAVDQLRRRAVTESRAATPSTAVRPGDDWVDAPGQTDRVGPTLRSHAGAGLFLALLIALPLLYVAALLGGIATPAGGPGGGVTAQTLIYGFAPFVLAFAIGALVAAGEVLATFPGAAQQAVRTRWAVLLVLMNGCATVLLFSVAISGLAGVGHPVAASLGIVVAFVIALRTRFVLARDLRGIESSEGVHIDTGWLYGRVQQACRRGIEDDLMRRRSYAAQRLLAAYPASADLERIARRAIASRGESDEALWRSRLDEILADDRAPGIARARLADLVVELSSASDVRLLVYGTAHVDVD